eukprot:gnl/Trimastix_PCT/816.p6 GENE.gnl/Trimastix_PCT/816~~gnl/Trimastix_PCT/816.p6  ORF type:complete len:177 (+),score=74.06 gnl/Trimastix_PCT/816:2106-2636(+)
MLHPYLTHALQLQAGMELVQPPKPGLAVLRGAILFGRNPRLITHRVVQYTYGMEVMVQYQEGVHPTDLKRTSDEEGVVYVSGMFRKFVTRNDLIPFDHVERIALPPVRQDLKNVKVALYRSTDASPKYVRDCQHIGTIHVTPATGRLHGFIPVQMHFGSTHIQVTAGSDRVDLQYL